MASNNECLIVILDVRLSASEELKKKSVDCVADIIKEKICGAKKDYISFILLGTENTLNDLNSNISPHDYKGIVQYPNVQECTWKLLTDFYKLVNEPAGNDGEWLDAVVLAMQVIKQSEMILKFQRSRILLFYDFNDVSNNYDQYDTIVETLNTENIQLIIVSDNVVYIDDPETGKPKAIFAPSKKTELQLKNEERAIDLTRTCADLCNFNEAPNLIYKVYNKRPWPWNATLTIGTKIRIRITGMLAIKDDTKIHMKKRWANATQQANRVLKSYLRGREIDPLPMDLIDAYMMGKTPIPYEEAAEQEEGEERPEKGLRLLGFAKRDVIQDEYFCGANTYWITHQKGVYSAARKLTALVLSMQKLNLAMFCWKVYSEKFNKPKMVVLLANELVEGQPATLTMIEHIYFQQKLSWNFPSLEDATAKCSSGDLRAMEDFIDAMDLTWPKKFAASGPRDRREKDLLPYESFPHIYEQNMMDFLERKILFASVYDDEKFLDLLKDKNFVEVFWKVPEAIEEAAKSASAKLKDIFPLEKDTQAFVRTVQHQKDAYAKPEDFKAEAEPEYEDLPYNKVGLKSPADDYRQLIRHKVLSTADRTQRDRLYEKYTQQLQTILWSLLEQPKLDGHRIEDGLRAYRETCQRFNAIHEYNEWMERVKELIEERRLHQFWQTVIVADDLGLCFIGELAANERRQQIEFYRLAGAEDGDETEPYDEMDDPAIDSMLANLDA